MTCSVKGCERPVKVIARRLCSGCYQKANKAGTLPPLPPKPSPPHRCATHDPSTTCYVGCKCRCRGCRDAIAANGRRRVRAKAYGRYEGYVDAEPVRQHVRSLMAPKVGSARGMGWKRIARTAGVPNGVVSKLIYGDRQRGMSPSKRIAKGNADRLLAVELDLADGAWVPAAPTRRRIAAMVEGGWSKAELARIVLGDVNARALQIAEPEHKHVTAGHARAIERLHRDWKAGRIVPRGRWHPRQYGPKPITPATPAPTVTEILRRRCEDCDREPFAGGRWCWDHYLEHRGKRGAA